MVALNPQASRQLKRMTAKRISLKHSDILISYFLIDKINAIRITTTIIGIRTEFTASFIFPPLAQSGLDNTARDAIKLLYLSLTSMSVTIFFNSAQLYGFPSCIAVHSNSKNSSRVISDIVKLTVKSSILVLPYHHAKAHALIYCKSQYISTVLYSSINSHTMSLKSASSISSQYFEIGSVVSTNPPSFSICFARILIAFAANQQANTKTCL